tara:strand:- start:1165 stop:2283 length:1119 start_codon:yes stop_codon:yes gene_type:complete
MLKKIFSRINVYINRPNFKAEKKYDYVSSTNESLNNIRDDLNLILNVKSDNYMDFFDKKISHLEKVEIKKKIISIIKNNIDMTCNPANPLDEINITYFNNLIKDGFSKTSSFDLNKNEVDRLINFFKDKQKFPGHIISNSNKPTNSNLKKSVYYTYQPSDILSSEIIQSKIFNMNFINLAENYFGCVPTCITLNLYCQKKKINEFDYLPQFFHRDVHDLKLLTFFVFLTNTQKDNGGHCYIKYSHDYESMKKNLKKNEISLLNDQKKSILSFFELDKNSYGHEDSLELLRSNYEYLFGDSGSSFVTDNFGLHRAIEPKDGERLIFWVSFGLFNNQNYQRLPKRFPSSKISKNFNHDDEKFKYIYRNYINFKE